MDKSQIGRAGELALELYALYAVVLLDGVRTATIWMLRRPDVNRLAYPIVESDRVILELRGRPRGDDAFGTFPRGSLQIGPVIVAAIRQSPRPPAWLAPVTAR